MKRTKAKWNRAIVFNVDQLDSFVFFCLFELICNFHFLNFSCRFFFFLNLVAYESLTLVVPPVFFFRIVRIHECLHSGKRVRMKWVRQTICMNRLDLCSKFESSLPATGSTCSRCFGFHFPTQEEEPAEVVVECELRPNPTTTKRKSWSWSMFRLIETIGRWSWSNWIGQQSVGDGPKSKQVWSQEKPTFWISGTCSVWKWRTNQLWSTWCANMRFEHYGKCASTRFAFDASSNDQSPMRIPSSIEQLRSQQKKYANHVIALHIETKVVESENGRKTKEAKKKLRIDQKKTLNWKCKTIFFFRFR